MIYKIITNSFGSHFSFRCLGCNSWHTIPIDKQGSWIFDGNLENPSISPSIFVNPPGRETYVSWMPICHSFVRSGKVQYLNDCTHKLAGQTIPLPKYDTPLE